MGKKRFEREVLLAKEEASEGVDAVPTASANAIPIMEPAPPEFDPKIIERGHPLSSLSRLKPLVGARATKMAFKTEFFGSGAVDTAPRLGDLIEACGFDEAVNVGTSVVYTPGSANLKTATLYNYLDGLLYKSLGAVGNMKIGSKTGEPVIFEFDTLGIYQDDADQAIVTPDFGANHNSPPQALSITFTLDAITTFLLREFNIDMGSQIIPRESMTAQTGFAGFAVGKRNPTGNIIIEMESKATYDFLAKWKASQQVAALIQLNGVAGNNLEIGLNLSYTNIAIEDADGLAVLNIPIALSKVSNAGNDEITITCK
jgi:hypothetical protein